MTAVKRWEEALRAWAIPEDIIAKAPESPYGFPPELFRHRTETAVASEPSASTLRALDALPAGGTVIDVGVGAGAASLPLAARASLIVGIDPSVAMLSEFREAAAAAGVPARTVLGSWPAAAAEIDPADVVVCHHVLYNVQDLAPFVAALTDRALQRVVVELTELHPLAWMNDLWVRFHGLERPHGPAAGDAVDALRELGLDVNREDRIVPPTPGGFGAKEEAVALVRRRLCLAPERDPEVEEALAERLAERGGLWSAGPAEHRIATLWWDRSA